MIQQYTIDRRVLVLVSSDYNVDQFVVRHALRPRGEQDARIFRSTVSGETRPKILSILACTWPIYRKSDKPSKTVLLFVCMTLMVGARRKEEKRGGRT